MSVTPKRLTPAQLTASAATYYTGAANVQTIIKKLTFTNSTATARTVTVYLVPSGGSAGVTNILTSARAVNVNETYECFEAQGQVLNPGDLIQALSDSATAVTIAGAVVEVTK